MDDSKRDGGTSQAGVWVYWGASGILQPLSETFLYRSPASVLRLSGCCRLLIESRPGRPQGAQ